MKTIFSSSIEGKAFNKIIHMQSCLGIGYDPTIKECNQCELRNQCKIRMNSDGNKQLINAVMKLNPFSEQLMQQLHEHEHAS